MKEIIFVVLDTNVWVAGINFDNSISRKILEAGGIVVQLQDKKNSEESTTNVEPYYLTSREILIEIIDTLRKYFDFADNEAYLWWKIICENTISVKVSSMVNLCRDPKDNKFLECAIDGDAEYLVSNDKDLLILKDVFPIPIVKIGTYYRVLFDS
jgi:putative PIN family toxin of toxin-antitoxin system